MPKLSPTQRKALELMEQGYQIEKLHHSSYTCLRLVGRPETEKRLLRSTLDFLSQNGLVVKIVDTGTIAIYANCAAGQDALLKESRV